MSSRERVGLGKVVEYLDHPPAQAWYPGLVKNRVTDLHRKELYRRQRGLCALCRRQRDPQNIDHDHDSKLVRGLLCIRCNTRVLGSLQLLGDPSERLLPAGKSDKHPPAWLVEARREQL